MNNALGHYELIDGNAIIDSNFTIITANEDFYRFIGMSTFYTLTDIIHQVDLDDFVEVANSLHPGANKSMVLRMKRVDNSFRWMLIHIQRDVIKTTTNDTDPFEYLSITVSDIQIMQEQIRNYKQMLSDYKHLLSLEGDIFYTIDCNTEIATLFRFVDNEIYVIEKRSYKEIMNEYLTNGLIQENDLPEFKALCNDVTHYQAQFIHHFHLSTTQTFLDNCLVEFSGSTLFENGRPVKIMGSITNIDHLHRHNLSNRSLNLDDSTELLNSKRILSYIETNITQNPLCEIALILVQIDRFDVIRSENNEAFVRELFGTIVQTAKDMVGFRGIVGSDEKDIIYIAIKNINEDVDIRAFIECLRNSISWNYKVKGLDYDLHFSIGLSRYPYNSSKYDMIVRKARRALEIAIQKGGDRYIIYREALHGELK